MKLSPHPPRTRLRLHLNPSFLFWAVLTALFAFVPALVPSASAAPRYKVLYSFTGGADGGEPGGLIQDAAGNLYGTTGLGGDPNCYGAWGRCGVVFKLDTAGKLTVLHKFTNGADGAFPYATLVISGNTLYGGASQAGNLHCYYDYGCGVLFAINIQTHALKVLHTFNRIDGLSPSGGLIIRSGVLYGTTAGGGTSQNCGYGGCGVVYKFVLKTGAYTVLHNFDSLEGASPDSSLTLDKTGKFLYGATAVGGLSGQGYRCLSGCGVAFRLTLKTSTYKVVYEFAGYPDDAAYPFGPLALDSSGALYGDSQTGGSYPCPSGSGCGTVFVVDPKTGSDAVLYNFALNADGGYPLAGTIRNDTGTLYGTTAWGGDLKCPPSDGCGVVFKMDTAGTETVLHTFHGLDGSHPSAVVIMDSKGDLFGTTAAGGSLRSRCGGYPDGDGCGVVWEITP
jgi:uncharacterized repeat protein (TIGR03803 family)